MDNAGGDGLLPQLRLDELLAELQTHLGTVLTTRDRMRRFLEAVLTIGSDLELETMLRRIVEAAVDLVDARYGALGIVGEDNTLVEFVPVGLLPSEISEIDHWPEGRGILGLLIDDPRPLRLTDISAHQESSGFPEGHPAMRSFVGVPVRVRDQVLGNLYLTEKRGGGEFTDDDEALLTALGAAAGITIENARLYAASQRQQRWLRASGDLTMKLLSGVRPEAGLSTLTRHALELSRADLVKLALPDVDGTRLTIEFAEGDGADAVRGLVLSANDSLSGQVLATGVPILVDDFAADSRTAAVTREALAHIGAAAVLPLGGPGNIRGVLTMARTRGKPPFPSEDVDVVAVFGAQAAVALELASRRSDAEQLTVLEDRDRIARDLHDLVIQRLYATGMSLEGAVPMTTRPEVTDRIRHAVDAMDDTIKDIRGTIYALQARSQPDAPHLRAEIVSLVDEMTELLGYAPALRLGSGLDSRAAAELSEQLLAVLREALSNAARHAQATRVNVTVDMDSSRRVFVLVRDNGVGMGETSRHSGLANMAERAEKLGGTFRVSEAAGGGTEIEWRVPVPPEPRSVSDGLSPSPQGPYPLR